MARIRSRISPATQLGVIACLLMLVSGELLLSQPVQPKPVKPGLPPTKPLPDKTILILVRSRELNEQIIVGTLKSGLEQTYCSIDGEPRVVRIPPGVYEHYERALGEALPDAFDAGTDSLISPLPTREQLWEFRLKSPKQILKSIKVTYEGDRTVEYTPAPLKPGSNDVPDLVLATPGRYSLRLDPEGVPKSYEATVLEPGNKAEIKLKGTWPRADNFFFVSLRNFRGDRQAFFNAIKTEGLVANPFKEIDPTRQIEFVFANFDTDATTIGDKLDGNKLTLGVNASNKRVGRIWMLFPLTEDQAKKELKRLRDLKLDERGIIEEVRKNALTARDEITLQPGTEPKWIELTPAGSGFARTMTVENLPDLQKTYPRVWRLFVQEFASAPAAIAVREPATNKLTFVVADEFQRWGSIVDTQRKLNELPKKGQN
jgi:hypothetical protein